MPKRINTAQIRRVYWPAWRAAEKTLLANDHSKEEAEEIRKEIHTAVTGSACSSKELTNRTLDECLKKFAAIATPRDGKVQADLADGPCKRIRFRIAGIQQRMALSDAYVETLCLKMARRSLLQCDEAQLLTVLQALTYHENRNADQSAPA